MLREDVWRGLWGGPEPDSSWGPRTLWQWVSFHLELLAGPSQFPDLQGGHSRSSRPVTLGRSQEEQGAPPRRARGRCPDPQGGVNQAVPGGHRQHTCWLPGRRVFVGRGIVIPHLSAVGTSPSCAPA